MMWNGKKGKILSLLVQRWRRGDTRGMEKWRRGWKYSWWSLCKKTGPWLLHLSRKKQIKIISTIESDREHVCKWCQNPKVPSLSTQQQESYFKKYKKGAIFSIELKRPFSRIVSNAMEARSKRGRHVAHQIYGGMEFYTIEFYAFPWEFKVTSIFQPVIRAPF